VQEKEKEAKAKKLKEARERKQWEKDTATSQKSCDTLNKGKRKASPSQNSDAAKRRSVVGGTSGEVAAPRPPSPPPKHTTRGRQIKLPEKFK
jgi:hypothetical protein